MLRACFSLHLKCPLHGRIGPQSVCYWEMMKHLGGGNWWKEVKLLKVCPQREIGTSAPSCFSAFGPQCDKQSFSAMCSCQDALCHHKPKAKDHVTIDKNL